jgi:hypothetical protein
MMHTLDSGSAIWKSLEAINPCFASLLSTQWDRPFSEFLDPLHPLFSVHCAGRDADLLEEALSGRFGLGKARAVMETLKQLPLIHTGPHLCQMLEVNALINLAIGTAIAVKHGVRHLVWYADTSASLTQRGRKGPAWLEIAGRGEFLFDVSRRRRVDPTASGAGGVRFRCLTSQADPSDPRLTCFQSAIKKVGFGPWPTYASALCDLNEAIFQQLWKDIDVNLIQLDGSFVSELVARHLEDGSTAISKILMNQSSVDAWKGAAVKAAGRGAAHFLLWNTDFFWLVRDCKRRALIINDGRFLEQDSGEETGIVLGAMLEFG